MVVVAVDTGKDDDNDDDDGDEDGDVGGAMMTMRDDVLVMMFRPRMLALQYVKPKYK